MRTMVSVGSAVRVHSRHGYDHSAAFPELAPLSSLASRSKVVLDGELVCLDAATGRPSFEHLMVRTRYRLPTLAARKDPATFITLRRARRRRDRLVRPPVGRTPADPRRPLRDLRRHQRLAAQHRLCRRGRPTGRHRRHGPRGCRRQTGHVALLARRALPVLAQGQASNAWSTISATTQPAAARPPKVMM